MTWIDTVDPDDAGAELRGIYDRIRGARGKLSDIMRAQSLAPAALAAHLDLYMALMFGRSPLSRAEREAIAVAVSVTNDCRYCTAHHRAALLAHWRDEVAVDRFVANPANAATSPRLKAMVGYAVRLTGAVSDMAEEAVTALRDAGLSDEEILHINLVTAYFNFVNRLAEGLGVEPAPAEVEGYNYE